MSGIMDSRDIQGEIEEYEDTLRVVLDAIEELDEEPSESVKLALFKVADLEDDYLEWKKRVDLREEVGSSEWDDGLQFIPADEWADYVEQMLIDLGELPKNLPDYIVIDWDSTAENVRADYSSVTYDGTEYYYRDC